MAFSQLNTFLLTTDGRIFSWGALTSQLGRKLHFLDECAELSSDQPNYNHPEEMVGEVLIQKCNAPITQIAAGR